MSDPGTAAARSYLFVPGDRPDRFEKALATEADRVVLDLEDAVAPTDKALAREAVAAFLRDVGPSVRARLVVRINDASTAWFAPDMALLQASAAPEVMLPKAEQGEAIRALRRVNPRLAVLPLVESAAGVLNAERLAAEEGVLRLVFGTLDFGLDLDLSGDPLGLDYASSRLSLASRAAGIQSPVAGVTSSIQDDARFAKDLARARAHGFGAKLCIHPRQVPLLHAALRPSAAEIEWARRIVAAAQGQAGAVQVDGRMVDRPVLQRAKALLQRADSSPPSP